MTSAQRCKILYVYLLKPSKYDDEGFVVRHWRGVVPSNTLSCLDGLTEDVRRRGALGEVELRARTVDETVSKIPFEKMVRLNRPPKQRVLACLAGVQSNQFCRAADVALALRREGVAVMLGGFHVSGMLAMFPEGSPEIRQLMEAGVSVVAGEVEGRWENLLRDACEGRLRPLYRFLENPPDLSEAPPPRIDRRSARKFVSSNYGTVDCGRGCPFDCSFCTIINVQGRKSRYRPAECVVGTIRERYRELGVNIHFFTDDNFARNPAWEAIFDGLIALREQEGVPVEFMMQVDAVAHRIPRFLEKAARAGCRTVFIGMESLNPRNLEESGKTQNRAPAYGELIAAWRGARIKTHVGYIIGFPHDSEESVRQDVTRLIEEVRPDQASFFMMTPLPGSRDHQRLVESGAVLDSDYNNFDSCHAAMPHPRMSGEAWKRAYDEAWRRFYSFENMKAILLRAHPDNYWDIFKNFFWYKNSVVNEGAHPMLSGIFRLKDRASRRAGFPRQGRLAHFMRRCREVSAYLRGALRLMLEMEELWLATRHRSEAERRVLEELARMRGELRRGLRIRELQAAYLRVKTNLPSVEVPSWLRLAWERVSLGQVSRLRQTRRDLARYWIGLGWRLRRGRLEALLRLDQVALNAFREFRLATGFFLALMSRGI